MKVEFDLEKGIEGILDSLRQCNVSNLCIAIHIRKLIEEHYGPETKCEETIEETK